MIIKKKFKCNIGYSGHENVIVISSAYIIGILFKRHITLDRTMYGSDQSSLEIKEQGTY